MSSAIPVVDVSGLGDGRSSDPARIARALGTAARDVGFFLVAGHGVPTALRQAVFAQADAFFALPTATKAGSAIDRVGDNRGWVGLATEALDPGAGADPKEAFNLGFDPPGRPGRNPWPDLPGFRPTMEAWFAAALDLGARLHRALAVDLGADPDVFADKFLEPMAILRLLHYPPCGATGLGAGAHTDYGNLTLLATDDVGGLEVRRRDGGWSVVPVIPDTFVVNIGDCLMRWSNDVYVSTPHRVVAPRDRVRRSVAVFIDPSPDAIVAVLPSCVPAGTAPKYPPIAARDHLRARLEASYAAALGPDRLAAVTPGTEP